MTALCARHPYDPALWDAEIHGETYSQRQQRIRVAQDVCRRCPMRLGCASRARPQHEEGVWGGRWLPPIKERTTTGKWAAA